MSLKKDLGRIAEDADSHQRPKASPLVLLPKVIDAANIMFMSWKQVRNTWECEGSACVRRMKMIHLAAPIPGRFCFIFALNMIVWFINSSMSHASNLLQFRFMVSSVTFRQDDWRDFWRQGLCMMLCLLTTIKFGEDAKEIIPCTGARVGAKALFLAFEERWWSSRSKNPSVTTAVNIKKNLMRFNVTSVAIHPGLDSTMTKERLINAKYIWKLTGVALLSLMTNGSLRRSLGSLW